MAQQQPHGNVRRKLGRAPHAAVGVVERLLEVRDRRRDRLRRDRRRARRRRRLRVHLLAHRARQRLRRLLHALRIVRVGLRQLAEHGEKAVPRAARAVARREIRAAEERLARRREPDAHRPAARSGQRLHRGHVDRVDVGPLLAVDLDADVVLVHEARDLLVLERLALHDVAPVAGRVADRQKDRTPGAPRFLERLVAPRIPVHRVVRVLQQIGARLQDQTIGVLRRLADQVMRARHVGRRPWPPARRAAARRAAHRRGRPRAVAGHSSSSVLGEGGSPRRGQCSGRWRNATTSASNPVNPPASRPAIQLARHLDHRAAEPDRREQLLRGAVAVGRRQHHARRAQAAKLEQHRLDQAARDPAPAH